MPDIYAAIRSLLAKHGDDIATPGTAWHCCELTAYAIGEASGLTGWFKPSTTWWRQMNIWNPREPWSPMVAGRQVTRELGTGFGLPIGPHQPQDLDELPPGFYLAQGWRVLPDPDNEEPGDGHSFIIEALDLFDQNGFQMGYIIESSKKYGLRISGQQWRGGTMPQPQKIESRLTRYVAGVGLCPLWPSSSHAIPVVAETTTADLVAMPEELETEMAKVEIDEQERNKILDTAENEFKSLVQRVKDGTITAGAVVEATFDLCLLVVTAVIPGNVDDMLVGLFKAQIDVLKSMLAAAADRAIGLSSDAAALLARAASRRADAAEHISKADALEAAGKSGGFFGRSPEKHRARAADLIAMAAADEAAAAALGQ